MLDLPFEKAIEVFVRAIAWLRSGTHPCLAEQIEGIWALRDAPRRRPAYRKEEWIAWRREAHDVDKVAKAHTRGRYFVGAMRRIDEPELPRLDEYRGLGYRLLAREAFFVCTCAMDSPQRASPLVAQCRVVRVLDADLAKRLFRSAGSWQIRPHHLADPLCPLRQYVGLQGDTIVGWVRSVTVGDCAWVSNLYVRPEARRQGWGTALMKALLDGDAESGVNASVLLASHAGAMLYPRLGYEKIGELSILVPRKTQKG